MRRSVEIVGSERPVPARTFERFESNAIAELGDSNNGRVIFLHEFPESCTECILARVMQFDMRVITYRATCVQPI